MPQDYVEELAARSTIPQWCALLDERRKTPGARVYSSQGCRWIFYKEVEGGEIEVHVLLKVEFEPFMRNEAGRLIDRPIAPADIHKVVLRTKREVEVRV